MLFVLTAIDKPDGAPIRAATRAAHLDFVNAGGRVKLGGPFLAPDGGMIGSLLIFEAENLEAAQAWAASDPYAKAGLFAQSAVRPWKATLNVCGAAL